MSESLLTSQQGSIGPNSLILVTGSTGYIASHVCEQLLELGFRVRGTARDPQSDKSEHLKSRFHKYGTKFQIVKAGDLEEENVFDEAVKDVDGIAHISSPFHFKVIDPYKDLINPAVRGTLSLLNSAHKYGKKVKHVVITSSMASVYGPQEKGHIYTESDWNDHAVQTIENDPKHFNESVAYRASKNAAERAAWKFIEEQKPSFGLSAINPPFVFGPVIHKIKDVESINTSVALLFDYFSNPSSPIRPPAPTQAYVDVRDVAKAHIAALLKPEASGKRFVTAANVYTWQQVVDILNERYPERKSKSDRGGEGTGVYEVSCPSDNSRSKKVLGITEYIGLKESVIDTVESLKAFW